MVFPLFAAFYYWTPYVSTKPLSERLGVHPLRPGPRGNPPPPRPPPPCR